MNRKTFYLVGSFAALVLLGQGCPLFRPPVPPPQPAIEFDVTKTDCDTIDEARQKVHEAYAARMKLATDAYVETARTAEVELKACLAGIWKGGPCDEQWQKTQDAYNKAWANLSDDSLYNNYKAESAKWKECHANWEKLYDEWSKNNLAKEKECQANFQAKLDAASQKYYADRDAAKAKRDADLAYLDRLEEECKKKKATPPPPPPVTGPTTTGGVPIPPGTPVGPIANPPLPGGGTACQPATDTFIPGENGTPRTGKPADLGMKDALINVMVQAAEDVTGTVIPTSAINDQIFAGIVCTKLHARILELTMEQLDFEASGRNRLAKIWGERIRRYERAKAVWCAIAQGKPALTQARTTTQELQQAQSGACRTDADCGKPVCCSATSVGTPVCQAGFCNSIITNCGAEEVCSNAQCVKIKPREKITVVRIGSNHVPITQLTKAGLEGCGEAHWHAANHRSVTSVEGNTLPEPGPQCGYCKVSECPVLQIDKPL